MNLPRARGTNLAFLVLMVLTVLAVGGGTAYVIQRLQRATIADAMAGNALQARAFEDHLTRTLGAVQRLADFIATAPSVMAAGDLDALFQRTLRQGPFLRSLSILDEEGRIVASSNPANLGQTIDNRDYYPSPEVYRADCLRIGRPWAGRDFAEGSPLPGAAPTNGDGLGFVPILCAGEHLGRRVRLVAAVNPDFFLNYFSQWLDSEAGFVEILRYDRMLLLTSGDVQGPGTIHRDGQLAEALRDAEIGQYQSETNGRGATFAAYRASRQFPLLVVTHRYRERALASWRQESRRLLLLVGPSLAAMMLLTTALYRRERRQAAEQVAAERRDFERLAATVFETIHDAVIVTDAAQKIVAVNPAFSRIAGYGAAEAIGADLALLDSGYHPESFFAEMRRSLHAAGHWEGEVRFRRKNGEMFVAWLSIKQVKNEQSQTTHEVLGLSDITEYRAEADRVAHLAHHDLLTGLPNRALFLDRLRQALHQAERSKDQLALIFFDLDRFKPVNDTLGHTMGDRLLQELAIRLQGCVRAADTLARLGGDEFVVLLPTVESSGDALVVAEKIRQAVGRPIVLDEHRLHVAASIGVAIYPDQAENEAQLLGGADAAMYQAKVSGGDRVQLYLGGQGQPGV